MADIQKYFEKFHEVIRVDYDMRQDLAEKRDIVVRRIEKHTIDNARPKPSIPAGKLQDGHRGQANCRYGVRHRYRPSL